MAILGSINSGLINDNTILNIKAILDGVISIVLTSIYGIGVIFSAISVTLYQGIFYLFASQIKDYLNPQDPHRPQPDIRRHRYWKGPDPHGQGRQSPHHFQRSPGSRH